MIEPAAGQAGVDLEAEVARLRRQVARERTRRLAAEDIGERVTADLFETVQELRDVQTDILERADRARIVSELSRELRQVMDSAQLLRDAARAIGQATLVDRCQVHVVDPEMAPRHWDEATNHLPSPVGPADLPPRLRHLLDVVRHEGKSLVIEDIRTDDRFDPVAAAEVVEALGVRGVAAAAMWVGSHFVGWLVLQSIVAREWQDRELAICEDLAGDLARSVLQVHVYEQQRQSVLRLEELDRAKDAFVSNVSHELRTPLTSISGYLELIAEGSVGAVTDEMAHAVDVAARNAARLRALVEDLLTMSAQDSEGVPLDRSPVDVGRVMTECHDSLRPTLAQRDLIVAVECPADLVQIQADRGHVERIVTNLLSNAVKFTPDGGRITARVSNTPDGIVLVVRDTGIGIPEHEHARLFSRFFRSSLSVTSHIKGTGLGLVLIKTLVEQHGGTVELASTEGQGTTVTVRLPVDGGDPGQGVGAPL